MRGAGLAVKKKEKNMVADAGANSRVSPQRQEKRRESKGVSGLSVAAAKNMEGGGGASCRCRREEKGTSPAETEMDCRASPGRKGNIASGDGDGQGLAAKTSAAATPKMAPLDDLVVALNQHE